MPRTLGELEDRTFAAVLFDMDGTLVDSTPAVVRSWIRWAHEEGLDPRRLAGQHGVPARGIIARLLPAERVEESVARIEAIEIADTADLEVLPGAAEALGTLDGSGRSAIVTSCTAPLAAARIEATALAAPAVVVTASDVVHGKPAPDPFLEAATRLGVDPRDCLVVEDAPSGLEAARAAGCATLAVTTTTAAADLVAEAVVGTLADVRFALVDGGVRVTGLVTGT
jgi:mannitol-1-/sugar-/sorbitol-6-phosphatase